MSKNSYFTPRFRVCHDTLFCQQYLVKRPGLAHFPGITYEEPVLRHSYAWVPNLLDGWLGSNSNHPAASHLGLTRWPTNYSPCDGYSCNYRIPGWNSRSRLVAMPLRALKSSLLLCSLRACSDGIEPSHFKQIVKVQKFLPMCRWAEFVILLLILWHRVSCTDHGR